MVLILGTANLIADGFSMSVSNFLGSRAARQQSDRDRREIRERIRLDPERERRRARDVLATAGFSGDDLIAAERLITADMERWTRLLSAGGFGEPQEELEPMRAAGTTMLAFVSLGALPLLPFAYDLLTPGTLADPFLWSAAMAGLAFFLVGAMKARFVDQRWSSAGLETLIVGGVAAGLAFLVGVALAGVGG